MTLKIDLSSFDHTREVIIYVVGFICVLFASDYFGKYLQKLRFPLITGFLLLGIALGPQALGLIKEEAIPHLSFINDLSLAFIAFAAGAELYIKEIRSRIKSIIWNTIGQLVMTFSLSAVAIYFLADNIHFMKDMTTSAKVAVSLLMATIFVARSPSSAIAIINEMRAKGPFTSTAIGVTVIIDVLVIILFTICFSVSSTLILGEVFSFQSIAILAVELLFSILFGYLLGKLIAAMLQITSSLTIKTGLLLLLGYFVFYASHYIQANSGEIVGVDLHFEPLLVCIVASFIVTNRSRFRPEFQHVIHHSSPFIYVAFFTLTGVMMSLDVLAEIWGTALVLFGVRMVTMIIGAYVGSTLAGDDKLHKQIGWMPYITQAGVGLGLAIEVSNEYGAWGKEFATLVIAVIVLNQLVGPPLFKWALNLVKESHIKADAQHDGIRDAIIFGYEDSSLSLARQISNHGWEVKLATLNSDIDTTESKDVDIRFIDGINLESLELLEAAKSESIILMLSDDENYKLCELIYEHVGTQNVVVRLHKRSNFAKFHKLGVLIVEPTTAIVSLMDHFVRSPAATSLLLGMEKGQETIDIEVQDKTLHGVSLRDIRIPSDIIVLSVKRKDQNIISHGYTRIRLGDILTLVGPEESLENTRLIFEM
ncbi:MAG: cation:proton antiporter [Crocinitomicaceae bacterium]|nr:cation:proton antiporter [Crocinitomicaceae bacterium]